MTLRSIFASCASTESEMGETTAPLANLGGSPTSALPARSTPFYIEERQLAKIVYRTNPVWPIYPIDRIPADVSMYLEGFKWEGERRPTRNEIFNRTERPSQREENEQQPLPEFPIRQFIDAQRERYVKAGMWADRNEEVDIQTVEWMRSLGFEVGQPYPER